MRLFGNIYYADVTSQFTDDTDYLPVLRDEIRENNPLFILPTQQPSIVSVKMTASSAFSVSFLFGEEAIDATLAPNGTDYVLGYVGGMEFIKFAEDTTLTEFKIDWFADAENWKTVSFDVPDGSSITVTTMYNNGYYTPDVNGKYYLQQGIYVITVTDEYSDTNTKDVFIRQSGEVTLHTISQSCEVDVGRVDEMILDN